MNKQDFEILMEDLYDAIERFEIAYRKFDGDFTPALIGQGLYDALSEAAEFYFDGAGTVGGIISAGHLISSRVWLCPCPELAEVIRTVAEILLDSMEVSE